MKNEHKLKELYRKMLAGEETPKEKELIARWLEQLEIADRLEQEELQEWTKRSREELHKAINPAPTIKSWTKNATWIASAAAILLFVSTVLVLRSSHRPSSEKKPVAIVYTEYSTIAGQRKLLTLSDGSRIWLGNASKVRYPEDFEADKREIFMEGQAFFEVSPDPAKPFYVHVGELDVQVLGTSFDVEHYTEDRNQKVTVVSGKVLVQAQQQDKQQWVLERGEQVLYSPADKKGVKRQVDLSMALNWKNGELIFRDEALETIAVQLERWYDVDITIVSPDLKDKRLSLSVKDEALERVLNMLSVAGNFRFEIQGRNIKLYKRKGGS